MGRIIDFFRRCFGKRQKNVNEKDQETVLFEGMLELVTIMNTRSNFHKYEEDFENRYRYRAYRINKRQAVVCLYDRTWEEISWEIMWLGPDWPYGECISRSDAKEYIEWARVNGYNVHRIYFEPWRK